MSESDQKVPPAPLWSELANAEDASTDQPAIDVVDDVGIPRSPAFAGLLHDGPQRGRIQVPDVTAELDAKTRADLSRWFGLPAITEKTPAPSPDDEEQKMWRERQEAATAACDPMFVEKLYSWEQRAAAMTYDDSDSITVQKRYDRQSTISGDFASTVQGGQVIDRETPFEVQANLRSCAPQALLRDLYRPEMFFPKEFEILPTRDQLPTDRLGSFTAAPAASASFIRTTADIASSRSLLTQMHDVPWSELPINTRRVK